MRDLLVIALIVLVIAAGWKIFMKAGRPGWAILVPIYNLFLWVKMAGKPGWWVVLMILPIVNIVVGIIVSIEIAKNFGKGVGFALGLFFLPVVFFPILGFGDATYKGPAA